MKSHTGLVAQQTRLSEWADLIRDCQNRPETMTVDEWCQLHGITKASYYWRLRKVREAYLKTAEQTPTFVEVPSSAIHPVNMTSEHKIAAVIRSRNNITLEITEQASTSLYIYHVIQADETPVLVNHDGRKAGSKSWMWVYRSGHLYQDQQIVLYEYQRTRNTSHPREFLKGYDGICVTDGYQVYHTLEKELEELTIAGCWVHCRRKFDDALKLLPKSYQKESNTFLLMKQIQAIYREEGKLNDLPFDERLKQRQAVIKPLVDAFFAYLKTINVSKKDKLGEAIGYALNQEKYLRVFLTDGDVLIDNNASERAIRGFCIGKKNWQMIDTINGAKSSAIIYSIVETAKANNLKPYDYVQYLLEEIPKHMDDRDCSFLEDLLPWSKKLPAGIRKV